MCKSEKNTYNDDIEQEQVEQKAESAEKGHSNQVSIKRQRLHPAAMYFNLLRVMKETVFGLGIGLILTLKESVFYFFIFISVFLLLLIISSVVSWLRFTYRVEENELRIEQGIFIRKKRYISIHRIHKIDLSSSVVHRLFTLTKVQIDTASSGDGAEVLLSAVTLEEGVRLRRALKTEKKGSAQDTESVMQQYPQRKITWKRLFLAGTTSGSVGVIIVAILVGFTQIEDLIPRKVFNSAFTWMVDLGIAFLIGFIIITLFLLWLFGIAGTMIKYGNFTIEKRNNELLIKRGLLETKELTIPFDRIQAIGIEQSIIRQPFKFVRIFAVVAGGSFDQLEPFPVLFPMMREREVEKFMEQFTPKHKIAEKQLFNPLAKRGRKYYLFSASIIFVLAFTSAIYFFPSYSWIPLLFIVISLLFGWMQHKDGGYVISGRKIILKKRTIINKVTIAMYHRRIQAFEKKQHKPQMMENLASAEVSLIGSGGFGTHYTLRHLTDEDANKIAEWYSYRKQQEENEPLT